MSIPIGKYVIESVRWPGTYLSMDGSALLSLPILAGGGIVGGNVTFSKSAASLSEQFLIVPVSENLNIYTIQSVATLEVYLRMDGCRMTQFSGSGGGVVNCQKGITELAKFKIVYNGNDGSFSIESKTAPFIFLRMSETEVNCQYGAHSWEKFRLRCADQFGQKSKWTIVFT